MRQTAEMGGAREIEHGRHGQPVLQRSGCGGRHGSVESMGGMDDHGSSTTPPSLPFFLNTRAERSFWRHPSSHYILPSFFPCTICSCPADLSLSLSLPHVYLSPYLDLGSALFLVH